MNYERRVAGIVDRLIDGLLFDPAIDLDTKRNIYAIRDDLNELIADIDKSLVIKEPDSATVA